MRIIDWDGCDYPYESIVISHVDGMIYARPVSNMEKQYFLARYSTEEKADKAMQKLHNCYQEWAEGVVFHFPSEDEIR